ncbi:hypothetical protein F2Q68_00036363 [Brassica cretica]|uniref:GPN-loop GTPase 3 n=1 Tax=Brassica cretica TaxID=69181 RepID=A0A8S9HBW1_BRACR|nr:hypothetical protein F2Q68_00036363 [Brassica cretica]
MGYAQLVIGRTMNVVNLDPAAEIFNYPVAMKSDWDSSIRNLPWQRLKAGTKKQKYDVINIRELVSLEDVMEEVGLGPNGALMYCMEYLDDSLHDWVDEELDNYRDDDYLIFDCPVANSTMPKQRNLPSPSFDIPNLTSTTWPASLKNSSL